MKQFFKEIREKEQKLTIEQEVDLFKQIATGSTEARDIIFYSNLRFAISFAHKYYFNGYHEDDLVQCCSIGLHNSIDNFDYTKGVKFISYARWNLQKEVTEYLNLNKDLIRLPAKQKENICYPTTTSYDAIINDESHTKESKTYFLIDKSEPFDEESSNTTVNLILKNFKPHEVTILKERIFNETTYVDLVKIIEKKHKITMSRTKCSYLYENLLKKLSKKYTKKQFIELFI